MNVCTKIEPSVFSGCLLIRQFLSFFYFRRLRNIAKSDY